MLPSLNSDRKSSLDRIDQNVVLHRYLYWGERSRAFLRKNPRRHLPTSVGVEIEVGLHLPLGDVKTWPVQISSL